VRETPRETARSPARVAFRVCPSPDPSRRGSRAIPAGGPSTVVVSLHQPSPRMFRSLERVLVLCGGRAVFCGSPSRLRSHLVALGWAPARMRAEEVRRCRYRVSLPATGTVWGTDRGVKGAVGYTK
jgi:hypothetical protein